MTYAQRTMIVTAAVHCLGIPYVFGGRTPEEGFDCEGLTQWCCAQAGIRIPSGSAAQFTQSRAWFATNPPAGCLAFFYGGETSGQRPGHVGIVTAPGRMIDAPYTGAHVRYDNFSETASIGPMDFMGYSDPAMEGKMDTKPAEPTLMLTNPYTIGLAVGVLQTALNRHGAKLTVDGIFGPLTEAAVKIFQKVRGLVPDGIVGPVTWSKLS